MRRLDTASDGATEQHGFSNDWIPTGQPAADFNSAGVWFDWMIIASLSTWTEVTRRKLASP